jgi:hypothetical protein
VGPTLSNVVGLTLKNVSDRLPEGGATGIPFFDDGIYAIISGFIV